jgi:multiple sugar transport system substrate-binding protein
MYERERDLIGAFLRGQVDRRGLIKGMGALGLSVGTAGSLLAMAQSRAMAADFDWKAHSGKKLKLLLNKHPYADAMIANLDAFKELTGIEVTYDVFPEDVYFDKVTAALSSSSSEYDAFMTGAYMTWTYGPAGWCTDLNEWIKDPAKTSPTYAWDDILEGVRKSCAWNGQPGGTLGSDDAKQWCIPWGFEQNNVTYNKVMFDKVGVEPPKDLDDLLAVSAKLTKDVGNNVYGVGVRGSRSWATIHPGFLSAYSNFGQKDLNVSGEGKLSAAMNTAESKDFHKKWVEMIQGSGPKDWSTYTWYQVGTDLGAGASAMIFDADILGYFQNGGTKEAGNLAFHGFKANPAAAAPTPNIWIWSLAMSSFSKDKDATWYFLQWASSVEHAIFGATKHDFVNPVRQAVWKDEMFIEKLKKYPGYFEMFTASAPGASIKFTAQPLFFDLTTEWAATLQKMVAKEVPVDEGLDQLAQSIDKQLQEAGLG